MRDYLGRVVEVPQSVFVSGYDALIAYWKRLPL